jgi:hypothetical protein
MESGPAGWVDGIVVDRVGSGVDLLNFQKFYPLCIV